MLPFPVPVLSFLFVSFRPSLIRFPQLFLRCLPCAFAFGIFRFPSGFFRPLLFRLRLLSLCFFRSPLPVSASQWLPLCFGSSFRLPRFPPSLPPGFPCFFSGSDYSALCSSVPFFLASPLRGFLSAPLSLSFLRLFPVSSCLISHAFLPGSGTQLSVCFLSPDRKSTRLNSSHKRLSRMPSSA